MFSIPYNGRAGTRTSQRAAALQRARQPEARSRLADYINPAPGFRVSFVEMGMAGMPAAYEMAAVFVGQSGLPSFPARRRMLNSVIAALRAF